MKKLIVGVVAVGVVLALRPVVKRRLVQKMQAHCKKMAARCKEMMGGQHEDRSEAAVSELMQQKMREHFGPERAHDEAPAEPTAVA